MRWDVIESSLASIPDAGHAWDAHPAAWVRVSRRADAPGVRSSHYATSRPGCDAGEQLVERAAAVVEVLEPPRRAGWRVRVVERRARPASE